jgi:hypothetical protein
MSKAYNPEWFNWLQEQQRNIWIHIKMIPEHLFQDIWNEFEKYPIRYWFTEDEQYFMIIENHLLNFKNTIK